MPSTQTRHIADRYKLVRPLGHGGMGVVWLAEDSLLTRRVAVKEIEFPPGMDTRAGEAVKARAIREARSAARLSHTAVVTIYDVMQEEQGAFIVMEYVDSPTLAELVEETGPLSPERSARIGLQILDALEVAHAAGIVHRDVKPGNIMVTAEDHVKLADFGIASVKDDPKITSTGMVLGSPQFMAPEQASGSSSDAKTDFWALGATLYYTVEGSLPFDRGRPIPTLAAVVHDNPRPMQRAGPLEPVVLKLLSKEPDERPSTAELKTMLERVAEDRDATLPPALLSEQSTTAPLAPVRSQPQQQRERRRFAPGAIFVLAVAALIATAVVFALRGSDSKRPADSDRRAGGGGNTSTAPRTERSPDGNNVGEAPADWKTYTDSSTGYALKYPSEWEISRDDSRTDFRDPETGTYLRVDWTDSPGSSPEGAWRELAQDFAEDHSNYSEIRIAPTTFKGNEAAIWEFTYTDGGASLHATDLGFVTDDYGFALFFQTHSDNWESSQPLFERLQTSFRIPD